MISDTSELSIRPPPEKLSFSAISLLVCPKKFFFEKVLKLEQDDKITTLPGSVHHDALSRLRGTMDRGSLVSYAADAVDKYREQLTKYNFNIDQLYTEVLKRSQEIYDIWKQYGVSLLGCEEEFDNVLDHFHGIIDVRADTILVPAENGKSIEDVVRGTCVYDYKVVGSKRARSQRDTEKSAQLVLYAKAAGSTAAGFIEIPRDLGKPLKFRVARYTMEELAQWDRWFKDQAEYVLTNWTLAYKLFMTGATIEEIAAYWFRADRSYFLCNPLHCSFWNECYGTVQ